MAGIGIGMVIASLCMMPFRYGSMSEYEIESAAKELGMIYPGSERAVQAQDGRSASGAAIQAEDGGKTTKPAIEEENDSD